MKFIYFVLLLLTLSGCAGFGKSLHEGFPEGTYILENVGRLTVGSGENMKQELLEDARVFCSEKNMNIEITHAESKDGIFMDRVPSARVVFTCFP